MSAPPGKPNGDDTDGKEEAMSIVPFAAAMKANNKSLEVFTYDGAQHGFHNDTTPRFDEKAAKLATERYMAFFNKNLR